MCWCPQRFQHLISILTDVATKGSEKNFQAFLRKMEDGQLEVPQPSVAITPQLVDYLQASCRRLHKTNERRQRKSTSFRCLPRHLQSRKKKAFHLSVERERVWTPPWPLSTSNEVTPVLSDLEDDICFPGKHEDTWNYNPA